ncbi:MAG TPA: NAD+ synthase [Gammaproteobacteria bacterium]
MSSQLRIVMAQLDLRVGDIPGNARKVIAAIIRARDELQAQAIVFPELTLSGYPPEDLLLRAGFQLMVLEYLERVKREVQGIDVILGYPLEATGGRYNAASLLREGQVVATVQKRHLPNYSVFDEKRYFESGDGVCVTEIAGVPVALCICEDIWMADPCLRAQEAGARLLLTIHSSPFHKGKSGEREAVLRQRVTETGLPALYVNLVGGQDELVFDGGSFVMNARGEVTQRAPICVDGLFPVDFDGTDPVVPRPLALVAPPGELEAIYKVLVLGVRDYVRHNGFEGVVIGLSGGVDSALTLAIAVDALGAGVVEAVMMPSRYTADMSLEDAEDEARALGVDYRIIPIEPVFRQFLDLLAGEFAGTTPDATEENIQARCRGIVLMAISNKKRKMVLTTGNKSEMSVGYATLYGDMAGGFAPIKDVPKLLVYQLCAYRNGLGMVIPQRVLERPPSAELAPDQKDEDSLPPYAMLDPILEAYVEQDHSIAEIIAMGFEADIVRRVATLVDRNEYKRRQAPPGVRITRRAFGRDRRYPITSGYLAAQMDRDEK